MPKTIVYRITYPNRKIYVGQNVTDAINYFGSASSRLIAADFTEEERQSFTKTKEILWQSEDAEKAEVDSTELHFILLLRTNNPSRGYNRWPKYAEDSVDA